MATMKSDHYHGARRIQGLVDRLNEFEGNVRRSDDWKTS
jgi:hypothetical protein